ncbi:MAG: TetR/AcrR family transcriptional regulator [Clostridiales Family XIII bacterium]|nr:TetR/AcrR family transcriptional regulator [Clostridiales Family XIII bacterium]
MKTARGGEKRKNDILDAAEELFMTKGYEKATVNDILEIVNIGKGTLYYYYKSKEEILNAIIQRKNEEGLETAKLIAADGSLSAHEKLFMIMFTRDGFGQKKDGFLASSTAGVSNAQMHQKALTDIVTGMAPILKDVVVQGIKEGVFTTPYPEESMEFLLAVVQTIFDETYFSWDKAALAEKGPAYVYIMERVLGARTDSFGCLTQLFDKEKLIFAGGGYSFGTLATSAGTAVE